jgi:hypothetical protein
MPSIGQRLCTFNRQPLGRRRAGARLGRWPGSASSLRRGFRSLRISTKAWKSRGGTLADDARGFLRGLPFGCLLTWKQDPREWNSTGLLPCRQQRQVLIPRQGYDRCPCQTEADKCERLDVHHCSTLPEQRDRIERLLAAFMGDQSQHFQLEIVPAAGVIVPRQGGHSSRVPFCLSSSCNLAKSSAICRASSIVMMPVYPAVSEARP